MPPGERVTFRRGSREQRRSKGIGYQVAAVDAEASTVALISSKGRKVAWHPARWGGDQAEAFDEVAVELRTGDRLQFTRNNRAAARNNGDTAEKQDGSRQTLDMNRLADRHVRHDWVRTIHSSQGATCDRVMAHMESFRANTIDAASAYVAIGRAGTALPSIPIAAPGSSRRWGCVTERRLARSTE